MLNQEFGISRYTLVYVKQMNKMLLSSTGNYIQYPVINHNGQEYEKEDICVSESLCCMPESNTTL